MSEDLKEDLHYYIHHYKVVSFAILAVVFYFLSFVIGFFLFRSNSDSIIRLSFAHYRHTTHFFFHHPVVLSIFPYHPKYPVS